ncbi:MAG: hypothetical protein AB7V04_04100 [Desulfomonilaceae bacterium]
MKVGPSESASRSGLQTTPSCCGQEPLVVCIGVKASGTYPGQVGGDQQRRTQVNLRGSVVSHRIARQNQELFHLLGQACRIPGNWAGGGRRIGGVTLIRAFVWNCGNQLP